MRPVGVVMPAPRFNLAPRVEQITEPTGVEAFVAQAAIKAFHVRILDRLARPDVYQIDAPIHTPGQIRPVGEVQTIVATKALWRAPLGDGAIQRAKYAQAAHRHVRLQRQTLAREHIHHGQDPQAPCAGQRVGDEVRRLLLVRRLYGHRRRTLPPQAFPLLPPQTQPSFAVNAFHPFMIVNLFAPHQLAIRTADTSAPPLSAVPAAPRPWLGLAFGGDSWKPPSRPACKPGARSLHTSRGSSITSARARTSCAFVPTSCIRFF